MTQWYAKPGGVLTPINLLLQGTEPADVEQWHPGFDPGTPDSHMTAGTITNNNINGSGWQSQRSDPTSTITYSASPSPRLTHTINPPASDNTNFARARIPIDSVLGLEAGGPIRMWYHGALPSDFWSVQNSTYMRFCGWDNFGNDISQEYRPGVYVYGPSAGGDTRSLKFMSDHEGGGGDTAYIWESAANQAQVLLPEGQDFTLEYYLEPAQNSTGRGWLKINGALIHEAIGVKTQPTSITTAEKPLTRAFCGIDGAAEQNPNNQFQAMSVISYACKIWIY